MGFMSGKKASYETDPYGAWNPMQKVLGQSTSDQLNNLIRQGATPYTGNYTTPLTSGEQEAIDRNARLSALGEQGLSPLLQGQFPEEYYQQSIYKPMMKEYTEDIAPLIQEQYAGPSGGYWGSARAGAVGKGYRDLGDTLAAKRAELGWQAQQAIPTAVNAANALSTTEAAMQATPRLIQQYGLDQQYNEWVRQQGANQEAINQALNFLNISTVTSEYKPGEAGNWGMIANVAGLALAPFTGGASIPIGMAVGQGIDAATSPTGAGGTGSQLSALAGTLGGGINWGGGAGTTGGTKSLYDKLYKPSPSLGGL